MANRSELARLSETVSQLANDVRRRAERLGRADLAGRITAEAERWADTATSVALVGPPGSGKSALLAALTGRTDLAPPGPTSCPLILRNGSPDSARVCDVDGRFRETLPSAMIIEPGRTSHVEVVADAPRLLDGVVLVDTPSIASPHDPRGNIAFVATRRVDHLVVVVDLAAPLLRDEVEVVARCVDRFAAVTLVGTRIDRVRGWRQVLADSVASLQAAAGTLRVEAFGVSPVLADAAFDPELDDAEAIDLLDDSGIGALQAHLASIVERRRHVRLANFTSLLDGIAEELARDGRVVIQDTVEGTEQDVARLSEIRHELTRVRDDRQSWFAVLSDTVASARDETVQDMNRTVGHLAARYDARIEEWKGDTAPLLGEFEDDIRAEAAAVAARIADRIEQLVDLMISVTDSADLGVRIDPVALAAELAPATEATAGTSAASGRDGTRMRAASGLVGIAGSTTMMMTAMSGDLGAAALMRVGALGAAALFTGVTTAVTVSGNRRQRDRQQARFALKARVDAIRTTTQPTMRSFFLGVQRSIEAHLKEVVRSRIAILERELTELQTLARSDATERRRRAASLEEELRALTDLRRRTEHLAASLADRGSR